MYFGHVMLQCWCLKGSCQTFCWAKLNCQAKLYLEAEGCSSKSEFKNNTHFHFAFITRRNLYSCVTAIKIWDQINKRMYAKYKKQPSSVMKGDLSRLLSLSFHPSFFSALLPAAHPRTVTNNCRFFYPLCFANSACSREYSHCYVNIRGFFIFLRYYCLRVLYTYDHLLFKFLFRIF